MPFIPAAGATGAILAGLSAAGTAVGVVGSIGQMMAQQKAAKYNADIATMEANQANQNALLAQQQADIDAKNVRRKGDMVLGAQRAQAGKSGIDLTGSFEDVAFDSLVQNEMDALNTRYKGEIAAYNYKTQANKLNAQASLYESQASDNSGFLSAGTTLLSGAANTYKLYSDYTGSYVKSAFATTPKIR